MALFAADEETAHGSFVADSEAGSIVSRAEVLAGGEGGEVGTVAFTGVEDRKTVGAERGEKSLNAGNDGTGRGNVILLVFHVAARRADCLKSVCTYRICGIEDPMRERQIEMQIAVGGCNTNQPNETFPLKNEFPCIERSDNNESGMERRKVNG